MKKNFALLIVFVLMFSCIIPVNLISVSAAEGNSFPYNTQYPFGLATLAEDQNDAAAMIQTEWNEWKSQRITASGAGDYRRVQRDGSTNFDTVSEGIGYGMILAVYFDEQALFDDLYLYAKAHFNTNGLMGWHVDAAGNFTTTDGGSGAATDADEDMGAALVFASKKWESTGKVNYETEAKTLIDNIFKYEVEPSTYVLRPGDGWGGASCTNPSYFAPAWYRIFAVFTGNSSWNFVMQKSYEILYNCRNYNGLTGLIPDWCTSSGKPVTDKSYDFKYDAIRVPWRLATDFCWYGLSDAKNITVDIVKFFGRAGVENIGDGYTIKGVKLSSNHSPAFTSCAAAGAISMIGGYDQTFIKALYDENVKVKNPVTPGSDYSYYGNTLRMLALLLTTGNFPNLYNYVPVPITPPPGSISGYIDAGFTYPTSSAASIKSGFKVEVSGRSKFALTNSEGYFELFGIPNGTYTIKISKDNYLYREITGVNINGELPPYYDETDPIKMWVGDMTINGSQDRCINMEDIMSIGKCFNSSTGDGRYDITRDINLDGAINMTDVMSVVVHFNTLSADYNAN